MHPNALRPLAALLVVATFAIASAVLYWQGVRAGELVQRQDNPRLLQERFQTARGRILDRNGVALAYSEPMEGGFMRRHYPYPSLAPVVGLLSPVLGATGIEAAADQYLSGQAPRVPWPPDLASLAALADPRHRPEGLDVVLTIDLQLQRAVEAAFGETPGAALVMDPKTGAILALVSRPTFDPNSLFAVPGDTAGNQRALQAWQALQADPDQPLLNRATQGRYTPGSTFKTVTLAAALETGVASPSTVFTYKLNPPDREHRLPWHRNEFVTDQNHTVESFDLAHAYAYSCNVAFSELGLAVGRERYLQTMRAFGLGEAPPLEIPVEVSAMQARRDFFTGQEAAYALASTAMGQGELSVTPLQMALITAAVANGGQMPVPHLMAEVRAPSGEVLWRYKPAVWKTPISKRTADTVRDMMGVSVQDGWARGAAVPGVRVGGKTGTAELGEGEPHAWFIGLAPVEDPQYVVVVIKERAGASSVVATPIAQRIFRAAFGI